MNRKIIVNTTKTVVTKTDTTLLRCYDFLLHKIGMLLPFVTLKTLSTILKCRGFFKVILDFQNYLK